MMGRVMVVGTRREGSVVEGRGTGGVMVVGHDEGEKEGREGGRARGGKEREGEVWVRFIWEMES